MFLPIQNKNDSTWIHFEADGAKLSIEVMIPAPSGNEFAAFYLTEDQVRALKKIVDLVVNNIDT
jgi:hypothetical protein